MKLLLKCVAPSGLMPDAGAWQTLHCSVASGFMKLAAMAGEPPWHWPQSSGWLCEGVWQLGQLAPKPLLLAGFEVLWGEFSHSAVIAPVVTGEILMLLLTWHPMQCSETTTVFTGRFWPSLPLQPCNATSMTNIKKNAMGSVTLMWRYPLFLVSFITFTCKKR